MVQYNRHRDAGTRGSSHLCENTLCSAWRKPMNRSAVWH